MKRHQQWFQGLPEHVRTVLRASPAIAVFLFSWVCASRTAPLTSLMIATGSAAWIATFQILNRSPLLNRQIASWLRQMNWDGQVRSLPFGSLVPLSEWLILIGMCSLTALHSASGWPLILCGWGLARLVLLAPMAFRCEKRLWLTAFWALMLAILLFPQLWAVPAIAVSLSFGLWTERRCLEHLARSSEDFPGFSLWSPPRVLSTSETIRLHPFSALRPELVDQKLSWKTISVIAATSLWSTASLCLFVSKCIDMTVPRSSIAWQMDHLLILCAVYLGLGVTILCHTMAIYRPMVVWNTRRGPISRLMQFRPIVWSYDRVVLPLVISLIAMTALALLPSLHWLIRILSAELVVVLLMLRYRPNIDEWQMTSDARLTSISYETKPIAVTKDDD